MTRTILLGLLSLHLLGRGLTPIVMAIDRDESGNLWVGYYRPLFHLAPIYAVCEIMILSTPKAVVEFGRLPLLLYRPQVQAGCEGQRAYRESLMDKTGFR